MEPGENRAEDHDRKKPRPGRWGRRIALVLALVAAMMLAMGLVLAFLGVPLLIQKYGPEIIRTELGRDASLESASFDPLTLEIGLVNLRIKDAAGNGNFVSLDRLRVTPQPSSLLGDRVILSEMSLSGLHVHVQRAADGTFDVQDILNRLESTAAEGDEVDASGGGMILDVNRLRMESGSITFADQSVAGGFSKQVAYELDVRGLSTALDREATVALSLADGDETVHLETTVGEAAASVAGKASIKHLDVPRYGAYFQDMLPVDLASALVESSFGFDYQLSTGTLRLSELAGRVEDVSVTVPDVGVVLGLSELQVRHGELGLDGLSSDIPVMTFDSSRVHVAAMELANAGGEALLGLDMAEAEGLRFTSAPAPLLVLDSLALHQATLPAGDEPVGFERLSVAGAHISSDPLGVDVSNLLVVAPRGAVVMSGEGIQMPGVDGLLALGGDATAPAPAPESDEAPAALPLELGIGTLGVEQGEVRFRDETLSPVFSTSLGELALQVAPLTLKDGGTSSVKLNGLVDGVAPLSVEGNLASPLGDLSADLTLQLEDLDLPLFSAHAAKLIAYPISSGRLSADVRLRLDRNILDMTNELRFQGLRLGRKVESSEAVDAPVELALALLQDGDGNMTLRVPVKGDTSNPDFELGDVIGQALGGALGNVVAAPFRLLGAIFSLGEEVDLNFVRFAPGRAQLSTAAGSKLEELATILAQRPSLELTLTALVDRTRDRAALEDRAYLDLLRERKRKALAQKGETPQDSAGVSLGSDEIPEYLALVYSEMGDASPDTTPEEMERAVRETLVVDEKAMQDLASQRSQAVRRYLVEEKGIAGERISILEPSLDQDREDAPMVRFGVGAKK